MSAARVARWMWAGGLPAQAALLPLVPFSLIYAAVMKLRAAAYRARLIPTRRLPLPAVAVGNLSVGGTGKTPLAAWIAQYYAERGRTPGILLRGYGADEPLVHRRLVSQAVVVVNADRQAGARRAQADGADVLILDDAFQLLAVERDLNIAVVSAESARGSPWPLPAGPWRERWDSLERADVIVVTRKHASAVAADAVARRLTRRGRDVPVCVARLTIDLFEGMQTGTRYAPEVVAGRRVVAAAGIADPDSFAAQLRDAGASVQLVAYQDHHAYGDRDLAGLVRASAGADYVVVTEKDAVKLRGRWPGAAPEPLVAELAVHWERNGHALEQALDDVLGRALPTSSGNGDGQRREPTRAS